MRAITNTGSFAAGRQGNITCRLVTGDENVRPGGETMNNPNGRLPQRVGLMVQGRSSIIVKGAKVDAIIFGRDNARGQGTYGLRVLRS